MVQSAMILPQIYISLEVKKELAMFYLHSTFQRHCTTFHCRRQGFFSKPPATHFLCVCHLSYCFVASCAFLKHSSQADPGSGLLCQGLLGISHGASSTSSVELEDRVVCCLTHVSEGIPAFSQPPALCSIGP